MVIEHGPIKYSPSTVGTYRDCAARFWHQHHDDGSGLLPTDDVPAAVSSAGHDALMEYHRQAESWYASGQRPDDDAARAHLAGLFTKQLLRHRLDTSIPEVAKRAAAAKAGLDQVAIDILDEMPDWAKDGEMMLVWAENWLDHGPAVAAVELEPGVRMPTRPDIIGIRRAERALLRGMVRDYKMKREPVDPAFDDGILLRAFWAFSEIVDPRCRWFLAGRGIDVDATAIDIETVNILHAGTAEFRVRRQLTASDVFKERDRLAALCREMEEVDSLDDVSQVTAAPGGFCARWCPVLHRCKPGMSFVRKYVGDEALAERLAELP